MKATVKKNKNILSIKTFELGFKKFQVSPDDDFTRELANLLKNLIQNKFE